MATPSLDGNFCSTAPTPSLDSIIELVRHYQPGPALS